jgi:hypothetical protein
MRLKAAILSAVAMLLGVSCLAATISSPFPFDPSQLSGWWGESYNTDQTCGSQNLKATMRVDGPSKRLEMRFDRKWKTELGESEGFGATIVSATARTLVVRYDNEKRTTRNGQLQEWELSVVAPGVYRWRETSWPAGEVNTVVGIRCSQ